MPDNALASVNIGEGKIHLNMRQVASFVYCGPLIARQSAVGRIRSIKPAPSALPNGPLTVLQPTTLLCPTGQKMGGRYRYGLFTAVP